MKLCKGCNSHLSLDCFNKHTGTKMVIGQNAKNVEDWSILHTDGIILKK